MAQRTVLSRARVNQELGASRGRRTRETHARCGDCSATLGRFIERDPIGFEAGDHNWYRFVANGPTGKVDPSGLACGAHLTQAEAKALACAIRLWLLDARGFNAMFLWGSDDRSLTLRFLGHYMSKKGTPLTVSSSSLLSDPAIKTANSEAKEYFARNSVSPFVRQNIHTSGDLGTAVGRTAAKYEVGTTSSWVFWTVPVIKGELLGERYTFLDTKPGEGVNVYFPFLSLEGYVCCWRCGDMVSDQWMADLERFGYAKSFEVKGEWTVLR